MTSADAALHWRVVAMVAHGGPWRALLEAEGAELWAPDSRGFRSARRAVSVHFENGAVVPTRFLVQRVETPEVPSAA